MMRHVAGYTWAPCQHHASCRCQHNCMQMPQCRAACRSQRGLCLGSLRRLFHRAAVHCEAQRAHCMLASWTVTVYALPLKFSLTLSKSQSSTHFCPSHGVRHQKAICKGAQAHSLPSWFQLPVQQQQDDMIPLVCTDRDAGRTSPDMRAATIILETYERQIGSIQGSLGEMEENLESARRGGVTSGTR